MKGIKVPRLAVVDRETGEAYELGIYRERRSEGKWMKILQDGKTRLIERHPEVKAKDYEVLMRLETMVKWGNLVPGVGAFSEKTGMPRRTVTRAYAVLLRAEFLVKHEGSYFLSPMVGWKGTEAQWERACREMVYGPREERDRRQFATAAQN